MIKPPSLASAVTCFIESYSRHQSLKEQTGGRPFSSWSGTSRVRLVGLENLYEKIQNVDDTGLS